MQTLETPEIEIKLLIEAISLRYGYDFSLYSKASLRRRFQNILQRTGVESFSVLQHKILHEPDFFPRMLDDLTVTTSDMFRDPEFFLRLRQTILPILRTYPSFVIWHAGCSTGEEVYSLAICLAEEGLADRATVFATDINQSALRASKAGIYGTDRIKDFTRNYQLAGGKSSFSDYYTAAYSSARMDPSLVKNVVFTQHNLVTDGVFTETHLILCRNVMIYFERELQEIVVQKFADSLRYKGFLALGSKESLRFLKQRELFDEFAPEKIYQRRFERMRLQ